MQNTVHVVTKAEHQYYGKRRNVGDEYDCESAVAEAFKKQGWITLAEEPKQNYLTRDLVSRRSRKAV